MDIDTNNSYNHNDLSELSYLMNQTSIKPNNFYIPFKLAKQFYRTIIIKNTTCNFCHYNIPEIILIYLKLAFIDHSNNYDLIGTDLVCCECSNIPKSQGNFRISDACGHFYSIFFIY